MKGTALLALAFQFISLQNLQCQEYIDVKSLPRPDCSGSALYKAFDGHKDKILVLPDSVRDSVDFQLCLRYWERGWGNQSIKRESELVPSDYNRAIEIFGPISAYKHWKQFGVPIIKTQDGFSFGGREYSGPNDGLTYLSPTRYVYTGNSSSVIWQLQRTYTAWYQYFVIRDGLLSLVRIPGKPVIDLDKIRRADYNKLPSRFYDLYVSKKLNCTFDADSIVYRICKTMDLPLPTFKIPAYIHSDPNAARLFANFFFMAGCDILPDSMKFGTSQFGSIHSVGVDYLLLRHESFHILWEGLVGNSGGNSFLDEGIEQYYEFLADSSNCTKAMLVARRHKDFDITNLVLIGNPQDFWGGPSDNGWPVAYSISGLFVKYLIDRWGLDKFKQFYVSDEKETALKTIYDSTLTEVIAGYKKSIQ